MKATILLTFIFFLPVVLISQHYDFGIGDTLTVVATNGLKMGDSKNAFILPYGTGVVVVENYGQDDLIDNREGYWLKVSSEGKIDYVSSVYLTKLKIPKKYKTEFNCFAFAQFEEIVRMNVDSLISKGTSGGNPYGFVDFDIWEIYEDCTIIKHNIYGEGERLIVDSKKISMEDILNLLENYITQMDNCVRDEEHGIPKLKVLNEADGSIFKITCDYLLFTALKTSSGIYVEANLGHI